MPGLLFLVRHLSQPLVLARPDPPVDRSWRTGHIAQCLTAGQIPRVHAATGLIWDLFALTTDTEHHCRYHPETPARWHCEPCQLALGECCQPHADQLPDVPRCPLCNRSMTDLGAGALVPPFWREPHQHFTYPFHRQSLIFLGILALVAMLSPGGFLGLLLWIALLAVATKYGFSIVEFSSQGYTDPPPVTHAIAEGDRDLFFRLIGVYLLFGLGMILVSLTGLVFLTILAALFVTLAFPASIMVLAIEKRALAAVNPSVLSTLMWRIGWPYLVLWVLVSILSTGPGIILGFIGHLIPGPLLTGFVVFIQGYFYFVIFRVLGYCLFQYQERLGYSAGIQRFEDTDPPTPEVVEPDRLLADAGVQAAEGRIEQARQTLVEGVARYPDHGKLNNRLERLLGATGDQAGLRKHLEHRLERCVAGGHDGTAVDTWLQHEKSLGGWLPESGHVRHRLALELDRRGRHLESLRLLHNLHKLDPDYEHLPGAYLKAAEILENALGRPEPAARLKQYVARRFG